MRLAADANVLLEAVLGGRSRLVFSSPLVEEILTTASVIAEVEEYAPILAAKRKLNPETVLLAVSALPVTVVPAVLYKRKLAEAARRMRDGILKTWNSSPSRSNLEFRSGPTTKTFRLRVLHGSRLRH